MRSGPLQGIRVLMLAGLGPGPFCGMVLADLGADVVRIDKLADVDQGAPIDGVMRRNQRSVAIDLKDPRGRDLTCSLAATADAFVDVYRPGVAERLGVGPDDLLERNPRLVYARMTGYGQDGPYAAMAGHDINYIALSGALHAIGPADTPVPPLNLIGDFGGGGMLLAVGLLSGILEARGSGSGQVIDVSMLDGAALLLAPIYGLLAEGAWQDRRQSNVVDGGAHFYRTYETADGKHFSVGAIEPQFYAELCARLGVDVPQAGDDPAAWAAHGEVMAARFRERTARRVGGSAGDTRFVCGAGAEPLRSAAASAEPVPTHLRGGRRGGATGPGSALLPHADRGSGRACPSRRPHAPCAGRVGARPAVGGRPRGRRRGTTEHGPELTPASVEAPGKGPLRLRHLGPTWLPERDRRVRRIE